MVEQRLEALLRLRGDSEARYHLDQYLQPKRSTVHLATFLREHGLPEAGAHILDAGCGYGAVVHYLTSLFPGCRWTGLDIKPGNIETARILAGTSATFLTGDLMVADTLPRADGMLCLQTLSWLPDPWKALANMLACGADWLALTSLFYDGPVEADICVRQRNDDGRVSTHHYNVYSLPGLHEFVTARGYVVADAVPFEIDEDLPRPAHRRMGTYTRRTVEGERLQLSGPLLLPWYTILLRKS